jgi:hypothetical protein
MINHLFELILNVLLILKTVVPGRMTVFFLLYFKPFIFVHAKN